MQMLYAVIAINNNDRANFQRVEQKARPQKKVHKSFALSRQAAIQKVGNKKFFLPINAAMQENRQNRLRNLMWYFQVALQRFIQNHQENRK
jgi:hypothetical protein